ncbi:MAG: hypothetical protein IVW55_01715 [Chloroflexi bacterium]|nr:hypothetical protein [Chloroflexota bacterium]
MRRNLNRQIIFALVGALVVLLAAWFLPLPRLVSGEEELIGARMPQTRATVGAAKEAFDKAQTGYTAYVKTHDMSALLVNVRSDIKNAQAESSNPPRLLALRDTATQVKDYLTVLQNYAQAGEPYFRALQNYDSDLMGWTRSLGANTEQFRRATFPIADHLRLYPRPVGDLSPDIPWVTAAQVLSQTQALAAHITALSPSPASGSRQEAISSISSDVTNSWNMGRSIERIESLHNEYYRVLQNYDANIQAAATNSNIAGTSPGKALIATGLDLIVGAVTLGGLMALFLPHRKTQNEEAQS